MDTSRSLPPTVDPNPAADEVAFLGRGQILAGRYEILRPLGRGGMGEVWQAFDLRLRVDVALKFLQRESTESLRSEIRAAREVISPNVCRTFDLIEADGLELLSMEYIDGVTLRSVLTERSPLDLGEAQEIAAQFLAGLTAIHAAGLVHGDFKPENVMITRSGRVVVMDFGLARSIDDASSVAGTRAYIAPEQTHGQRADIFAVGVVLAEMIHVGGVRERAGVETVWNEIRHEPPRLSETPWAPILVRALAKNPEERFGSVAELSRALDDATRRFTRAGERSPYPGLSAFTESEAQYFFGREAEIETMLRKLSAPARILGLIGPSGVGKSSFVRAGLVPAMPARWAVMVVSPGSRAKLEFDALRAWRGDYAGALLVVDQAEELFTLNTVSVQSQYAELLARIAIEGDIHVLISMRDDFLIRCHQFESLTPIFSDLTPLLPPSGGALRRAIVQPAVKSGYGFEDDSLVGDIVSEAGGERGVLPLIAFAMSRLWEERDRQKGVLTRAAYDKIGGVAGALAQHAEATLSAIGSDRIAIVRELFRNLVTAQGTRIARDRDELLALFSDRKAANEVFGALIAARLLTSYEADQTRIEIIHESLLTSWPRLVRWRAQDAEGSLLRDQLRQAAYAWKDRGQSIDLLWGGTPLREYELWRERYAGTLTPVEQEFGSAMVAHARRKRRRSVIAAAVAIAILSIGLIVMAVFRQRAVAEARRAEAAKLLALGRTAIDANNALALAYSVASLELSDTAEARQFAAESLWRGPMPMRVPLPKGEGAGGFAFSPDGKSLAVGSGIGDIYLFSESGGPPRMIGTKDIKGATGPVAFAPDGDLLVSRYADGKIRIWSIKTNSIVRTLDGTCGFQVIGDLLYTCYSAENDLRVLSVSAIEGGPSREIFRGKRTGVIDSKERWMAQGDCTLIGLDAPARSIALWKSEAKTELPVFPVVSFTNDGTRLACADSSGEIRLWSLSGDEPRLIRSLKGRERPLQIAFDPAARFLAAVVESAGVIELWDLDAPPDAEPRTLTSSAYRVAFDSRGRWMASTDRTGSLASIWPLSRRFPFRLDRSGAEDLDFSADSAWLIATRPVQGVSRTPLRPSIATRGDRLTGPNSWGAAADHTGRRILVGGEGRAAIFQGGTETQLPTSAGHALFANAFSFDGKLAAAGTQDFGGHGGEIWLWNLESGERRVLKAAQAKDDVFNQTIWDLEFLRDGNLLSGGAGEVRLWNLHSGTSRQIARAEGEVHMDLTADERNLLVVATTQNRREGETTLINMKTNVARRLISHSHAASGALDPSGKFVVTWSANEPVGRISSLAGEDAHLLISGNGNGEGGRSEVAVSPDGKWIASSDGTGTRLWPTPDLSQRPFQTLPFDALMAKLRQQTNMRVVADKSQRSGYRIDIGELPSWKTAPTW